MNMCLQSQRSGRQAAERGRKNYQKRSAKLLRDLGCHLYSRPRCWLDEESKCRQRFSSLTFVGLLWNRSGCCDSK